MSSLFGAPKPGGGSLFGGGAPTTAQSTTPAASLFGGAPAVTQSLTMPTLAGLAGMRPSQAQPQQAGLSFSVNNNNNSSNNNNASTNNPPIAQPGAALFDSILAKAKKQADGGDGIGELPSLQLGLSDLQQRLRKLGPRGAPLDGRAHYLLAGSGVDPGAAVKDLGAFAARAGGRADGGRTPAGAGAVGGGEVDVDAYLSNLQSRTTLSMIADGLERSVRDFDSFLEENVTMEWEEQRKRIYEHFGIKPREDSQKLGQSAAGGPGREATGGFGRSKRSRNAGAAGAPGTPARGGAKQSAFGRTGLLRSVIGSPSRIGPHGSQFVDVEMVSQNGSLGGLVPMDERFLDEKQRRFIHKIHVLNDSRMMKLPYPILHEFAEVTARSGDVYAPKLVEAYKAMVEVVGEDPDADPATPGATAKERQFAQSYIHAQPRSQEAVDLRRRILAGANRYLEKQALEDVENTIAKAPLEANLGGRPDIVSKIRAYIRVLAAKKNLVPDNVELQQVQGEYVWAIVFYLLRTGHVSEAATYVNDNQSQFRSIDRTFSGYINSYAASEDRRLKRPMQERCANEYQQRVRNAPEGSIDPYRMACYKIVGRCELANRGFENLKTGVEDWIWLQFNLAREGDRASELASESYGLAELQSSIQEIGSKHFAPKGSAEEANSGSFAMFFFLQVLCGMYEAAIAYLYAYSRTDAVHFAIALEYYGLLRPADAMSTANELKSFNTRGLMQINFAPLVGLYTQDFRAADVAAAVDYIVLICLNMDNAANEADRQQAALCHEALRALVLETREFSKLIGDIRPDGRRIRGMIEERGRLVALEDEDEFLRAISLEAARAAEESGRTTTRAAHHLAGDYDASSGSVLLQMSEIKDLIKAKNWPEAVDKIRNIQILPLDANGDPSIIRSYASVFAGLSQPVAANVPNLVMWTTECCTRHRERLAAGHFTGNESTARALYDKLKQMTVDLTTYTSQLRYRFPPAILEALAKAAAD
ncbi:nucleoporin NIC96 [Magnaporthiopsis poae ATCC 64411]|uniref:Nuclear pore protein n=1 Tax=Magnaporthiopsis poae (strain ATCC 64411 / 73-15) TaxID=644358 RepID=A0A0C4E7Z8_MAGP6|nr:nucleoporin NIC96 [Magnaporthiopsis poae ATCC 64411]